MEQQDQDEHPISSFWSKCDSCFLFFKEGFKHPLSLCFLSPVTRGRAVSQFSNKRTGFVPVCRGKSQEVENEFTSFELSWLWFPEPDSVERLLQVIFVTRIQEESRDLHSSTPSDQFMACAWFPSISSQSDMDGHGLGWEFVLSFLPPTEHVSGGGRAGQRNGHNVTFRKKTLIFQPMMEWLFWVTLNKNQYSSNQIFRNSSWPDFLLEISFFLFRVQKRSSRSRAERGRRRRPDSLDLTASKRERGAPAGKPCAGSPWVSPSLTLLKINSGN